MKTLKSMLSIILVIAMLLTSVAVFADETAPATTTETTTEATQEPVSNIVREFPDVAKTEKYYDAVQILNKLDIIKGYEDGTFGPMKNVTRAEFATMIIRFLGMSEAVDNSKENLPFPDIDGVDWAIGNIRTAKSLGIINGYEDGTFRPNNNVSFEEAVKMIVCTLGYEYFSQPGANWYDKYMNSATKLGLLKDVMGALKTPATRSCISQLLYNSLEVEIMENNEITEYTPLDTYLRIQKYTGVITSNGLTSTSGDVYLNENTILVDDFEFYVDNPEEYKNLMGAKVTVYYKKNRRTDRDEVVILKILSGESAKVNAREVLSASEEQIKYYIEEADTTKTVKLEEDNVVIYNGRLYGETEEDSSFFGGMIPAVGTLEFVDTNKNGVADVIYIEAYEMYYVSLVTSATCTITDKLTPTDDDRARTLVLDQEEGEEEIHFYDEAGNETTFSKIKKGNVLAIRTTNDGEVIKATILTKNVVGTVSTAKEGKNATIGGNKYSFSYAAPWFNGLEDKMAEPQKSDEGKFFLDINGDIFLYDKSAVTHTYQYGFLLAVAIDENEKGDEYMQAMVLNTSGTKEIIDFQKKTRINGDQVGTDYDGAKDRFEETAALSANPISPADMGVKQLIKYTTVTKNGAKTFDEIVTVTDDTVIDDKQTVEDEILTRYTGLDDAEATYSSSKLKANGKEVKLSSTKVFVVPLDVNKTDKYKVGSTSSLKSSGNKVEVFDVSSTAAKVVVIYGSSAAQPVNYNTAVCRIVEEPWNDDDRWSVKVYDHKNKKEQTYLISEESEDLIEELEVGDLVRFSLDADGYRKIDEEYVLYSYQEPENMNDNMRYDSDTDKDGFFYYTDDNSGDKYSYKYLEGYEDDYEPGAGSSPYDPLYGRKASNSDITMKLIHGWIYSTDDEQVFITVKGDEEEEVASGNGYCIDASYSNFSGCQFYEYATTGNNKFKCTRLDDAETKYEDLIGTFDSYVDYGEDATEVIAYLNGASVKAVFIIR